MCVRETHFQSNTNGLGQRSCAYFLSKTQCLERRRFEVFLLSSSSFSSLLLLLFLLLLLGAATRWTRIWATSISADELGEADKAMPRRQSHADVKANCFDMGRSGRDNEPLSYDVHGSELPFLVHGMCSGWTVSYLASEAPATDSTPASASAPASD